MTTNRTKAAVVCNRAVEHYVGFRADTMAVLNDALADGPLGANHHVGGQLRRVIGRPNPSAPEGSMSDQYQSDVLVWSEHQAELLRRLAAGERVNDQVDWQNVIEEIESVGSEQLHSVE